MDSRREPIKDPCPLCECLSVRTIDRRSALESFSQPKRPNGEVFSAFFHDPCDECPRSREPKSSVCSFCAHFRPWHLFFHALPKHAEISDRLKLGSERLCYYIRLGNYVEIRTRASHCGFCDFIVRQPQILNAFSWANICVAFNRSGVMLCVDNEYVGHLVLDLHPVSSAPDYRRIDWNHIKGWLSQNQPLIGKTSPGEIFADFRLIDVSRRCVVRVSEPTEYAALSYVWGESGKDNSKATNRNISVLEREEGLVSIEVPNTVRDAMIATKELGLQYLWVDRICIVQDDKHGKLHQINNMDRIFGSAYVTLVAEYGDDAMSGLPGVVVDRQKVAQAVIWNGIEVRFPFWPHFKDETLKMERLLPQKTRMIQTKSAWASRGWTYQEAIVSKRLLYFTHQGVFLEDEYDNEVRMQAEGGTCAPERQPQVSHPSYVQAVREIMDRKFTRPTDILLAFSGVLNWIAEKEYHINNCHRFGFPFQEFDFAIQWQPEYSSSQRSSDDEHIFPSWSWASIHGYVGFNEAKNSFGALATWAFCERTADNLLPVRSRPKVFCENWKVHEGFDVRVAMTIAWHQGCFATSPPFTFSLEAPLSSIQTQIDIHTPTYDDFWRLSRGDHWHQEMFSYDDCRTSSLKEGRLMVHTQCAFLYLQRDEMRHLFHDRFHLRDPSGQWMGEIFLSSESECILSSLYLENGEMRMEFLALAVGSGKLLVGPSGEDSWRDQSYACTFEIPDFNYSAPPVHVVVMLIYRCGSVARRLGIGYVILKLWGETEREFKTVILE